MPLVSPGFARFARNISKSFIKVDSSACSSCGEPLLPILEALELSPEVRLTGTVTYCSHCRQVRLTQNLWERIVGRFCLNCRTCASQHIVEVEREPQTVRVGRVKHIKQCSHCSEEYQRILLIPRVAMPEATVRRERTRKHSLG